MSEPRFYVHSEEFWGHPPRKWAVFERLPMGKWRRVSGFYVDSHRADRVCLMMIEDDERYRRAMADKQRSQKPEARRALQR